MRPRTILGALLIALALTGWFSTTQAQGDEEACKSACEAAREQCVDICGQHSNPIECEGQCRDDAEDCHRSCS
jgi:hypothetical protein